MELSGKIIQTLPIQEGSGKNGKIWAKQEYILETPGQYPKKVCFSLWNGKIDEYILQEGQEVTAHIEIESREYNSRWYTEIKAWKIEKHGVPASIQQRPTIEEEPPPVQFAATGNDDDLPF